VIKAVNIQAPKAVWFLSPKYEATITVTNGGTIKPRNSIKSVKKSVEVNNGTIPFVAQAAPGKVKIGAKIIVIISIVSVVGKPETVNTAISVKTVFNPK